jgi:Flp pilus assembly protein TadB
VRAILDDLIAATSRDLKLLEELETEGLEMRINARAVMVLPWLVLIALTARPGAFRDFYQSPGGIVTLMLAGVLTIVGVVVLGRLGREPVEARPFASGRA